jgi:membrane-bound metal-dependent hydrolase YbcI (DUF457 family)
MKGLSHFVSGIAAASFLREAVQLSALGGFPLLLAGLAAMVPDVLDFRIARFMLRLDVEARLDPEVPDPQAMAEQIAGAVGRAAATTAPVIVQLHVARTQKGLWRQYTVSFGTEVRVCVGPLVATSGRPAGWGSVADAAAGGEAGNLAPREGRSSLARPVRMDVGSAVKVDAFGGPTIALQRREGWIEATFLPWHRAWSHSLLLAAAVALLVAVASRPLYGALVGIGVTAHILGDQLGYMGSNLLWPLTRRRTRGLGLFHSGDALPNLFCVWLGTSLIVYNLDRFAAEPMLRPWPLLGLGAVLPWAIVIVLAWLRRLRLHPGEGSGSAQRVEEMPTEGDLGSR